MTGGVYRELADTEHAAHLEALMLKGMQSRRDEVLNRKGKLDRRLDDFERNKLRKLTGGNVDCPDSNRPKLYDDNRPDN